MCLRESPLGSERRPPPAEQRRDRSSPAATTLPPPPFPPPVQARESPRPAPRRARARTHTRTRAHAHTHRHTRARALLSYGHSQTQRFLSHLFRQPGLGRPSKIGTLNPHSSEKRGSTTLRRECTQPMRVRLSTESAEGHTLLSGDLASKRNGGRAVEEGRGNGKKDSNYDFLFRSN